MCEPDSPVKLVAILWRVSRQQGPLTSDGCIRCHDGSHTAKDGSVMSGDCEYCHVQVEEPPSPTAAVPTTN